MKGILKNLWEMTSINEEITIDTNLFLLLSGLVLTIVFRSLAELYEPFFWVEGVVVVFFIVPLIIKRFYQKIRKRFKK